MLYFQWSLYTELTVSQYLLKRVHVVMKYYYTLPSADLKDLTGSCL